MVVAWEKAHLRVFGGNFGHPARNVVYFGKTQPDHKKTVRRCCNGLLIDMRLTGQGQITVSMKIIISPVRWLGFNLS